MLALDDGAMARIAIAATGVHPAAREEWLMKVATALERAARPREKQRAYRQRKAHGRICLPIAVDEADAVNALVSVGALANRNPDRDEIRIALERLLADWAAAWR